MQQHSGIELMIDVTNKNKVVKSLKNNEVDFALVSILPNTLNIEKLDLLQNKLYLVGNTETKFKKGTKIKEIFKDLPLLFKEKGSGTRQTMGNFIKLNNISVLKKMELTYNESVKQSLVAGLGYSIMPLIGIKNELQIISIKGLPIITTWSLIWLKGKKHSPVTKSFLEYNNNEKAQIVHDKFNWYEQY